MKNVPTIKKIAPNANSIHSDGEILLQSYQTIVCRITNFENGNKAVIEITEGQPQSATTKRDLNRFLKLYTEYDNYKKIKQ